MRGSTSVSRSWSPSRSWRSTVSVVVAGALVVLGASGTASASVDETAAPGGPTAVAGTSGGSPTDAAFTDGTYLVQLAEMPVASYRGGTAGLRATHPTAGRTIDPTSAIVTSYVGHLKRRQTEVLQRVGTPRVTGSYVYSYNGVAAVLTAAQAEELSRTAGVLAVTKDVKLRQATASTPRFLGLDAPGGLWSQLGGTGLRGAGEGVVVGIVDSGIWPENPSFDDRTGTSTTGKTGKLGPRQIPGWHGRCVPGEAWTASQCSQKLIGARWFSAGFGGDAGVKESFPYEFASARGADGHGSHTAGTAAGNVGVPATIGSASLGTISGMAPNARIAVYKTCWGIGTDGGCYTSDNVAAIDQAVADGVDVINYSISGSTTSNLDPVEVAFLFAQDAGVFVAASAGNSGPGESTVAHNSPWLTTVAAGTHDRQYAATVTLGNGTVLSGAGLGAAVPSSPLVTSTAAAAPGAVADAARLCLPGSLARAAVAGKIVVCDRGVNARTQKSDVVAAAGGVGMVLVNTSPNSLNADLHAVPTVHVQSTDRPALLAYAATAGATASLSPGSQVTGAVAPDVASFSSRGPALTGSGDLLKPDVMAPGVDVLAAVSPVEAGRNFDFLSGTSMSSPHIAGIAALLVQAHPDWTPMMIKSAIMTSASQVRSDGTAIPGTPFAFGSGQVVPNSAVTPGLVYDVGFDQFLSYLCGTGELRASYCPSITIDPSDLNQPSIAVGALAGSQTVTRRVTNVGAAGTWTASSVAPPGTTVSVKPATLTLAAGASADFTVTMTRVDAALGAYTFGSVTWANGVQEVRSAVAVRPVAIAAPVEVALTPPGGSYPVTFGVNGPFAATPEGLVPATRSDLTVPDDPDNSFAVGGPGVVAVPVTVPPGTSLARFQLFDEDTDGDDDIDLYVYLDGAPVGSSGGGTSAEKVDLVAPAAGTYTVYVHGWQTDGPEARATLSSWVVPTTDTGTMTVTGPATAVLGATGTISVGTGTLTAATRYLGRVRYSVSGAAVGSTVVSVTTP